MSRGGVAGTFYEDPLGSHRASCGWSLWADKQGKADHQSGYQTRDYGEFLSRRGEDSATWRAAALAGLSPAPG